MRTMNEGQAADLLRLHFGLDAPVAFEDVKKRYKQESRRLHPDAGGTAEHFRALCEAFNYLKRLYELGSDLFNAEPAGSANGEQRSPKMPRETVEGIPLSELGLGLGPTTNGRPCAHCEQRGYTVTKEHARGRCQKCSGSGRRPQEYPCVPCSGSGKFTQRRTGRVVDCLVCDGSGKRKHPFLVDRCSGCGGLGTIERVARIYAMKCWECKGTGEIKIWNPVIPKGRLVGPVAPPAPQVAAPPPSPPKPKEKKKGVQGNQETEAERLARLMNELKAGGIGCKRK